MARVDHHCELYMALAEDNRDVVDRLLMFEAIAVELVAAGSVAVARRTLQSVIEPAPDGRWRLIGNSWTSEQFVRILGRNWRTRDAEPLGRRGDQGVPWATLTGWIEDELRPRGLLAPSSGPGRPRRGESKYAFGPNLSPDF
jgi:hypothetical protein